MPGAVPNGKFPKNPTTKHETAADIAVATTASSCATPASAMICGLTSNKYDKVKNDAVPARNSVPSEVPRSVILKYESKQLYINDGMVW